MSLAFTPCGGALRGGYMSVDVLFAISGFLFFDIVVRCVKVQKFRFGELCIRRICRNCPALPAVVLVS